jgi:hypothetical protein
LKILDGEEALHFAMDQAGISGVHEFRERLDAELEYLKGLHREPEEINDKMEYYQRLVILQARMYVHAIIFDLELTIFFMILYSYSAMSAAILVHACHGSHHEYNGLPHLPRSHALLPRLPPQMHCLPQLPPTVEPILTRCMGKDPEPQLSSNAMHEKTTRRPCLRCNSWRRSWIF